MNPSRHVIDVSQAVQAVQAGLDGLRSRLRRTRWPVPWPGAGWAAGTDAAEPLR